MTTDRQTHRDIVKGWHPFTEDEIAKYVAKGYWQNQTVCDLLDRNAEALPDKLAVADDTKEVTWKELQTGANRVALHLKQLGVEYGDFFILQMVNILEFFYLFYGLNRIGAVPVMCLPRHRKLEVNHELGLHRAKGICLMVGEKFDYVQMVEGIKDQHPYLKIFLVTGGQAPNGWVSVDELLQEEIEKDFPIDYLEQFRPDPNDICCEQLSGGSTGVPKGIPRTHNDYICEWRGYVKMAGNTEESVMLITIPIAHNAAFIVMSGPATTMGASIVMTKSPKPKKSFELIEKYGVTDTMLIPVQVTYWKEADEDRKHYDLSSLKILGVGAQKLRPELAEWCLNELGVSLVNHYGMAEGPMIGNRWNSPPEAQMYTVGFPMFINPKVVEIKVVNEKNQAVGRGEIGEVVTRGLMNFRGYFRNPEENQKAFDEKGFFHTGDLMSLRPDGRFVVEGRKKDMIIRGGENVYPEAVEDLLIKHPKVLNVAVVGMPDDKLGEKLCAFIQLKQGEPLSFDEVKQFMKDHGIAVFQWPERVEFVEGWPLTPVNKIDKRRLRVYITVKLFEEGVIEKEFGDEYLKSEKITINDVQSSRTKTEFAGTPQ